MVPTPSSVKISNSRQCGTRPSMMVAECTPPSTARAHASIFGTIPEVRPGINWRTSSGVMEEMMVDSSG